jgi:hypothetical protein
MGAVFEHNDIHWMYFLALEEDFRTLSRFVEVAEPNMGVYSIECTRMLLSAGSEVDVVAHLIAAQLGVLNARDMGDCRQAIVGHLPWIASAVVTIPRFGLAITPFSSWATGTKPVWWAAYNHVKHERSTRYAEATLANALEAIAGLFVLLTFHLRKKGKDIVTPAPVLLRPDAFMGSYAIYPEGQIIDLRPQG